MMDIHQFCFGDGVVCIRLPEAQSKREMEQIA